MQALDRARQKNEKLNDLDEEAKQKAEYLLQKAKEQQEEQEDEIKHLNEVHGTPVLDPSSWLCILTSKEHAQLLIHSYWNSDMLSGKENRPRLLFGVCLAHILLLTPWNEMRGSLIWLEDQSMKGI